MERSELVRILEEIARDEEANPTARCTAIRTLKEVQDELPAGLPARFLRLYENGDDRDS